MTLYTQQESNIFKTWLFIGIFLSLIIFLGWFFSEIYDATWILILAVIIALTQSFLSYWYSDKIVLSLYGAREVKREDNPDLYRLVENVSIAAGLPVPKIYIIDDPSLNAFATGRDPNHSVICFTSGLLQKLEKVELEGVIAHEMSHIGNRDILLSTVIVVLAGVVSLMARIFLRGNLINRKRDRDENGSILFLIGIILILLSPLFATLLRLAISRKREFLADATGALITRYPEGLARALEKIALDPQPLKRANEATAHLFISDPFKTKKLSWFEKLWLTHPPVEERIKALREMSV